MLVMTLSSPTRDGVAESVLVVVCQGVVVDCHGAVVDHPSGATDHQGTASARQGATVNC
jgi:hypothetical protein